VIILKSILPFLIDKRAQAETAIEFSEVRGPTFIPGVRGRRADPNREAYIKKIKELKRAA